VSLPTWSLTPKLKWIALTGPELRMFLNSLWAIASCHFPLKYYLYKLDQTDNSDNSAREQKKRNSYCVHAMISPSKGYTHYIGKANLTPEEVVSVAPRQVLNFFGSLELPWLTKGHITIDLNVLVIKGTFPNAPKQKQKVNNYFYFFISRKNFSAAKSKVVKRVANVKCPLVQPVA